MKIVPFDEGNVAYAVQLGRELIEAGTFGLNGPPFEWDYALACTRNLMRLDTYYLRLAYNDDGAPCGFVFGHVAPFYHSPKLCAYEDGWFVRPGTKGRTKIAFLLMRGFVSWALDERRALLVQSGDIASIDSWAVDAAYKKLGFKRFGSVYKYAREA